jgi:FdhD protein
MRVLRVDSGEAVYLEDEVVEDVLFHINLNSVPLSQMMAYDQYLEELAVGHLVTSNLIHSLDDVHEVKIKGNTAFVQLVHGVDLDLIREQKNIILEQASRDEDILLLPENDGLSFIDPDFITTTLSQLNEMCEIYKNTGGTHSVLIIQPDIGHVFVEDVGRFNAVDKAVGLAVMHGLDLSESILATSGRLSGEMVLKAAFARVPVMCSVSAPLCTGVRIARGSGMTIAGFTRGQRYNVYTGFRRLSA